MKPRTATHWCFCLAFAATWIASVPQATMWLTRGLYSVRDLTDVTAAWVEVGTLHGKAWESALIRNGGGYVMKFYANPTNGIAVVEPTYSLGHFADAVGWSLHLPVNYQNAEDYLRHLERSSSPLPTQLPLLYRLDGRSADREAIPSATESRPRDLAPQAYGWIANLFWPVIAGFPAYYAGNHGFAPLGQPTFVLLVCCFWGLLVVPAAAAMGVTSMFFVIRRPNCPTFKKRVYGMLLALFLVSLVIYVPIHMLLWNTGITGPHTELTLTELDCIPLRGREAISTRLTFLYGCRASPVQFHARRSCV